MTNRRERRVKLLLVAFVFLGFCGIGLGGYLFYWDITRPRIMGSVSEYKDLESIRGFSRYRNLLPRAARNIEYFAGVRRGYLSTSFEIGETEFLEWTRKQGWSVKPVDELNGVDIYMHKIGGDYPVHILDGYYYKEQVIKKEYIVVGKKRIMGETEVAFDRRLSKAYFWYNL